MRTEMIRAAIAMTESRWPDGASLIRILGVRLSQWKEN